MGKTPAERRLRERRRPIPEHEVGQEQVHLLRSIRTIVGWLLFLQLAGIVATVIAVAASS
jgi:hypothetical protein